MTNPEDSTDRPQRGDDDAALHDIGLHDMGLHDMGGDIGPTPPPSRGGGGLGPQEVREADERNQQVGDRTDRMR